MPILRTVVFVFRKTGCDSFEESVDEWQEGSKKDSG